MAITPITIQTVEGPFAEIAAGEADVTLAAGDAVNGNSMAVTGKEVLLAHNSSGGALTMTITSVIDEKNRTKHITDYSLAAGDYAVFLVGMTMSKGWKQTDGTILVDVAAADILLAALKLTI